MRTLILLIAIVSFTLAGYGGQQSSYTVQNTGVWPNYGYRPHHHHHHHRRSSSGRRHHHRRRNHSHSDSDSDSSESKSRKRSESKSSSSSGSHEHKKGCTSCRKLKSQDGKHSTSISYFKDNSNCYGAIVTCPSSPSPIFAVAAFDSKDTPIGFVTGGMKTVGQITCNKKGKWEALLNDDNAPNKVLGTKTINTVGCYGITLKKP